MKTVKIISDTFLAGKVLTRGEILELDDATAGILVGNYKAEYCEAIKPPIEELPVREDKPKRRSYR